MSKKRKVSDVNLRQFWRDTITRWRNSDLSVRQFCKDRGLSSSSFYYWRKKLTKTKASETGRQKAKKASTFIEVSIPDGGSSTLELVLTSGNTLKISPSIDNRALSNVLSVLRESGLC